MARFPRILPVLSVFAAASLTATACLSGEPHRAEDEWVRSYPLPAGGRVEIENQNGSIDAQPADGAALEVVAKRVAKARSEKRARELLAQLAVRERVSEGRVSLEVVPPSGWRGDTEVRFTLRVPKGVAVDLRTANGSVRVAGLDAPVTAETVNGAVRGSALATNSVVATSVNGAVQISLSKPLETGGKVALETVNGRVALDLPAASRAHVNAETVNGSIEASGAAFEFETKSRTEVEATLNGGGANVQLETVNGAARVTAS
jgi:hypothetical protein